MRALPPLASFYYSPDIVVPPLPAFSVGQREGSSAPDVMFGPFTIPDRTLLGEDVILGPHRTERDDCHPHPCCRRDAIWAIGWPIWQGDGQTAVYRNLADCPCHRETRSTTSGLIRGSRPRLCRQWAGILGVRARPDPARRRD